MYLYLTAVFCFFSICTKCSKDSFKMILRILNYCPVGGAWMWYVSLTSSNSHLSCYQGIRGNSQVHTFFMVISSHYLVTSSCWLAHQIYLRGIISCQDAWRFKSLKEYRSLWLGIYPNTRHDVTQSKNLAEFERFSFSKTCCHTKVEIAIYLSIFLSISII